VRGNFESNDFVKEIVSHIERKTNLGDRVLEQLTHIQKSKSIKIQ